MRKRLLLLVFLLLTTSLFTIHPVAAVECGETLPSTQTDLDAYKKSCEQKIQQLQSQGQTLKAAIDVLNSKIRLAQAQIAQTINQITSLENDIGSLSVVVSDLDESLNELARVYTARVQQSYKHRDPNPLTLFLSSDNFAKFFTTIRYLKVVKARDQLILSEITAAKNNFDAQKNEKIEKQKQVEALKVQLDGQKQVLGVQHTQKNQILIQTQNDEKKFQSLLDQARAELEAINAILAGKGTEIEEGKINAGDKIASIISGDSVCSNGSHVHLEITKDNARQNPASFLKPSAVTWDLCGWWGVCDDPFSFTGNLEWPVNQTIRITQGYGMTGYAKSGAYGGSPHTGIDITSTDLTVKAINAGTLFRGFLSIKSGCKINGNLQYKKIIHDGGLVSYYLHVNYTL